MTKTTIRKFVPADRPAIEDICYQTGFMGNSAENFWGHKTSFVEMWVAPYMDQEPDSLYVAVKDEKVVGYLTGCLNTATGPNLDALMMATITKHKLFFRLGTAGFLFRGMLDSLRDRHTANGELTHARWPAHLHINLLSEARGTGLGSLLMNAWLEQLRQRAVPGCYLSTILENKRAVTFFEKNGFQKYGEPTRLGGMRGKNGERLHQQIMVWSPSI